MIKGQHRRAFEMRAGEATESGELWVEGRAVAFDCETVLWEEGGVEYKERIESGAFDATCTT